MARSNLKLLTSIFTLKKSLKNTFTEENIKDVLDFAKTQIIAQVKKQIKGTEKKEIVDNLVIGYISKTFVSTNSIVRFLVNLLIYVLPTITQFIYEALKSYIDGLTKE